MERVAMRSRAFQRSVEVALGLISWGLITSPVWASFVASAQWSWAFLGFSIYWFAKSLGVSLHGLAALRQMGAWEACPWLKLGREHPRWAGLHHLVVYPTFREPLEVLEASLRYLKAQDFPHQRIAVLVACEARDPDAPANASLLHQRFGRDFGHFWTTFHPDRPGEVRGKSSNLAFAVPWARRLLVEEFGVPIRNVVVTACDADSRLHPRYLSALAHRYLTTPHGEHCLYQGALLFHANLERLPGPFRALNGLYSVLLLARLGREHTLVTQSTYSLGLAACEAINYWDADIIPEDSHTFFKAFFRLGASVRVQPIYLPVWADAAEGRGSWATLRAHYRQARRWAWGISDVPYVLWHGLRQTRIPLWLRVVRAGHYVEEHLVWAAHWFVLAVGLRLLPWTAPWYANTPQAMLLGDLAWAAFTACLPCLFVILWIDQQARARHVPHSARAERWPSLTWWLLIPWTGLVASVLPAMDAHARLLLGWRLEYQVTEKLAAARAEPAASTAQATPEGLVRG